MYNSIYNMALIVIHFITCNKYISIILYLFGRICFKTKKILKVNILVFCGCFFILFFYKVIKSTKLLNPQRSPIGNFCSKKATCQRLCTVFDLIRGELTLTLQNSRTSTNDHKANIIGYSLLSPELNIILLFSFLLKAAQEQVLRERQKDREIADRKIGRQLIQDQYRQEQRP